MANHGVSPDPATFFSFLVAALNGYEEDVAYYLMRLEDQGMNVNNIVDAMGRTALHIAVANGHGSCVEILLALGANPEIVDNNKRVPLHYCLGGWPHLAPNLALAALFIERGADFMAECEEEAYGGTIRRSCLYYLVRDYKGSVDSEEMKAFIKLLIAHSLTMDNVKKLQTELLQSINVLQDLEGESIDKALELFKLILNLMTRRRDPALMAWVVGGVNFGTHSIASASSEASCVLQPSAA